MFMRVVLALLDARSVSLACYEKRGLCPFFTSILSTMRTFIVKKSNLSALKISAAPLVLGLALMSAPVYAQDAAEDEATEEAQAPIVVTGSRIARPNLESAAPVTVVSAEDFKGTGSAKVEDLINNLPQVVATQSSGVSNGSDGTATVSLRALGTNRTLVLIDGRRLAPAGIGGGSAADLNFIPSALISSVEVLTGGASATYGADAVAGVVNFKMNRTFEGVRLDGQYSFYQHDNGNDVAQAANIARFGSTPNGNTVGGGAFDVTLALGTGIGDRGNIVAYAGYRRDSKITQAERDFSACTLNPSGAGFACGGSGTPERTRIGGFTAANAALAGLPASSGGYTLTAGNTLIPYSALRDGYNFGPLNYYRRPSNRFTAGVFAEYEINENFKPYIDAMFMDYSTKAQIAPSGAFFAQRNVNCDNPYLLANPQIATAACGAAINTPTQVQVLIGKRNTEGGPRFNDIGFNQFRIVTGMKGDITENWGYDVSAQFGKVNFGNVYRNDVSESRIQEALLATGTLANPVCTSGNASCVPYNLFNAGGVTQAAAGYIGIPLVITGATKQTVVSGTINGDLGISLFSDETIKAVFGAEWRKEQLQTQPDQSYINGDGAGQGGPTLPIDGSYSVRDFFSEVVVPIVADKPFFQDLSLELGFRNSSYKIEGRPGSNSSNTFKIAGNWQPIDQFKLRGSLNRAVRSPNVGELFLRPQIGLFSGSDPCVGGLTVGSDGVSRTGGTTGTNQGFTLAQCQRTGVTAAQFGNLLPNTAEQYNALASGNLNVTPEKADTFTAGAVLTPFSGMTLSVDYFNIKVKNAITAIGGNIIVNQCAKTGNPFVCSKVNRAPASAGLAAGSLWLDESGFVDDQTVNTGSIKTAGIDVNFDWRVPVGENRLNLQFVGTYLDNYTFQPITNDFDYNCAGFYGTTCGNPLPKWRHNAKIKFTTADDFGITLGWRFLDSVKADTTSADVDLAAPGAVPLTDEVLGKRSFIDLLFSVPIKDTITFRLGINNIFDTDPPLVSQAALGGFGNGNVFPGTYDYLGRYIFANFTADF